MSSEPPPGAESSPPPGSATEMLEGGEDAATDGPKPVATAVPLDTDDTRSQHLRRLAGHPVTLSIGATAAIAALIAGTIVAGSIAIGAAAAGGVVLLTALIVFMLASGHAKEDFFRAYAEGRGLSRTSSGSLAPATPLLRRGDKRYAHQIMRGALPGEVEGTLALYTYEDIDRDSEGDDQTTYYHFTVVLVDIPESARFVSELYAQRRFGFRFLDSAEDAFRTRDRVTLESEALDKRAEIFAGAGEDQNWLRQLFSPTFVHWLGDESPEGTAFELVAGLLCVNVKGHAKTAADLDAICESAGVIARRIREESAEAPVGG